MKKWAARIAGAVGATALMLAVTFVAGCLSIRVPLEQRALAAGDVESTYGVFLPSTYNGEEPMPLVIALHRFTGSGQTMAYTSEFNEAAEREGFIAAYPDGIGRRWNTEPGGSPDDIAFILAMLDALEQEFAIDSTRVYLTGASNGGFMSYLMACEAGDRFAAFAPVMATMPKAIADNCSREKPMPVVFLHGTEDPVVPYDGFELQGGPSETRSVLPIPDAAAFWAEINGCAEEPVEELTLDADIDDGAVTTLVRYLDCENGAEVLIYRIEGGGHTWPGGREIWPSFIVGGQTQDYDGATQIWRFFEQHQLHEAEE